MKNIFLLCCILMSSCSINNTNQSIQFESYDFQIKGFAWAPDPYKLSQHIQDSVLQQKGGAFAAWQYSYIGDHKNTLITWDDKANPRKPLTDSLVKEFKTYQPQVAIPYILEKTKNYQITLINEAHHMPQHRVFTTQLLTDLYQQGYRHLGMEALFNSPLSDSLLLTNGYPVMTNGFYTIEPQFGNLIRSAQKIGFQLFGYESEGHNGSKEREINQAKNIKTYLDKHPNEKILIHCGFAHAAKGNYGGEWGKTMAGRLIEFTDINPLSINQTSYAEKSSRSLENPFYQMTDVKKPTVFVNEEGQSFGKYRGESYFDIYVFHPRTQNFDRPQWLIYGNRQAYEIDLAATNIKFPCMVLAYKKGERIGTAVPYDIQEIETPKVKLILAPGKYDLVLWNTDKTALLGEYEAIN